MERQGTLHQINNALEKAIQESVFANFDRDGNMALDFEEFVAMQPRRVRETHTRDEMKEWFQVADEDGNGTLSINEFFKWSMGNAKNNNGAVILEHAFKKFDKNNSGSLDAEEFKKMAMEMGFAESAQEAFVVLDADGGGYITYKEVLAALQTHTPRSVETKKLLFGCIWSWGLGEDKKEIKQKQTVDTSKWHIRGRDADTVREELRTLLRDSGAHVTDLCRLFDDDQGGAFMIDEGEFMKTLKKFGFRGMPSVIDEVFASIDIEGSGKIAYDEFYEFVRGHRHSLDGRERTKMVRELAIALPANSPFTLADIGWEVQLDFDRENAVESLRLLMQDMLLANTVTPNDLLRAWDRTGDKQLDRREFMMNVRRLFRNAPELWKREVAKVADHAFVMIQQDGSDINSTQMDIVEFERWLDIPTRRRPDQRFILKPRRKVDVVPEGEASPNKWQPIPPRPGCDIPSRAAEALTRARTNARRRDALSRAREAEKLRQWEQSHMTQINGQKWSLPPLQRWEMPPRVAERYPTASPNVPLSVRSPRPPKKASPRNAPDRRANARLLPLQQQQRLWTAPAGAGGKDGGSALLPFVPPLPPGTPLTPRAFAEHMVASGLMSHVQRDIFGRRIDARLRSSHADAWQY